MDVPAGQQVTLKALWRSAQGGGGERGGTVTAQVLRHVRGPKVIVFKKRPKKGYKRTQGHRQEQTEIEIKEIQP